MSTPAPEYTMTKMDPIELAGTTYEVEIQRFESGTDYVWFKGPRGTMYRLMDPDKFGVCGLISFPAGNVLRKHGNAVWAVRIGDIIEQLVKS